jgi:hypothetical protein
LVGIMVESVAASRLSLTNKTSLKIILCEPLASIILFYPTSSINLVLNLHEYNILFITYIK